MPACRPYLLPCLAVGLLSLVATCSSIFLLSETLPRLASKQYMALHSADEEAPKLEGGLQDDGLEGAGEGPALVWNAAHGGSAAQIDHLMGLIRRPQCVMPAAGPSLEMWCQQWFHVPLHHLGLGSRMFTFPCFM